MGVSPLIFKRIAALLLAAGSFGAAAAAPLVVLRAVPTVACITPRETLYEKRINATGTIEAQNVREVYLDTPVIAQAVNVSVGDYVRQDQVLAVIDADTTKSVLEQSIPASSLVSGMAAGAISQETADLAGLYSALQSSAFGTGLDLGSLQEVYEAAGGVPVEQNPYLYVPETITAPMDGVVTEVGIKSGVLSRTAKPVVTISDTGSFAAMVTVGESYISDVKVGDPAVITGTGFPGREYTGHVRKIAPVARKLTGGTAQEPVVDVEIAIDDPDNDLKAGFTARAEIVTDTRRTMLTVPYEAVRQDENNVEYVYLAEGSRAVRRDIQTGVELLEGVEVTEGLGPSDVLLADASAAGKEGALVNLQRGERQDVL